MLIRRFFGIPNPGSAAEKTMHHAINTGKIQAGEVKLTQGTLSNVRIQLQDLLKMDVDISVIKSGGPFDKGPVIKVKR